MTHPRYKGCIVLTSIGFHLGLQRCNVMQYFLAFGFTLIFILLLHLRILKNIALLSRCNILFWGEVISILQYKSMQYTIYIINIYCMYLPNVLYLHETRQKKAFGSSWNFDPNIWWTAIYFPPRSLSHVQKYCIVININAITIYFF